MPIKETYSPKMETLFRMEREEELDICPPWQRGTIDRGIWDRKQRNEFITSIMNGWPFGCLTMIKRKRGEKWKLLDGGNRMRCLRDFREGKNDGNGKVLYQTKTFEQLSAEKQAHFKTCQVPVVQVQLLPDSIPDS